jgi:asparagine synthase (glutamine-hydrolysing)
MCGVIGIFSANREAMSPIERMAAALAHRGPDGVGVWTENAVGLAHTRLAIIDRQSRASQPMHYGSRYVLSFNGEIYNYRELRNDLKRDGYGFNTESDTEVIMAAFDRWGVNCLNRFNGMWAFVLVDRLTRRVFIARDRFGVKPLYFAVFAGGVAFASETKALLCHPRISRNPDLEYSKSYLKFGPREYDGPTPWIGVERLEAAHYIETGIEELLRGEVKPRRYWALEGVDSDEPYEESRADQLASEYRELLDSAVRLRLRSDVKVGSALSGGLDSSSVVSLVNAQLKAAGLSEKQETFSCVYRTPGTLHCDESSYINLIAARLDVNSNQIEPAVSNIPEFHRQMIYFLDHPPESTLMSSWHTFMRVAMTDVVVTLDGQGADEQLAGYPRYLIPHLAYSRRPIHDSRQFAQMPGSGAFVGLGLVAALSRHMGMPRLVPRALAAAGKRVYNGSALNSALAFDCVNSLQNLIHYADRTSMAFSIESRMPFLDFRLAEFLAKVPSAYKIYNGWTKHVARRAFDGILPDEIVWRRDKMGWPIPEGHWFQGELRGWLVSKLRSSRFLQQLDVSEEDLDGQGSAARLRRSIRLLNLAVWHDVHVERGWSPQGTLRHSLGGRFRCE